jgi:hypothetical protein
VFDEFYPPDAPWNYELWTIAVFLYFFLPESLFHRSPGKWLFELKLVSATRYSSMPFACSIFLRTFVLLALADLITIEEWLLPISDAIGTVIFIAGFVLIFSTMRRGNGYAGLHELVSGTRVVRVLPEAQRPVVPQYQIEDSSESSRRRAYGPYLLVATIWQRDRETLLLAFDERLQRNVWIHLHGGDSPVDRHPASLRPGRLRWLQSSDTWDAYEAPSGSSLRSWISKKGPLDWHDARLVLRGLTNELQSAAEQGDSHPSYSIDHVWIDGRGEPRLLEFPFPEEAHQTGRMYDVTDPDAWRSFLTEVAAFCINGRESPAGELRSLLQRPLPQHARRFLRSLIEDKTQSIDHCRDKMTTSFNTPARLTNVQRVRPVLITTFFIANLIAGLLYFIALYPETATELWAMRNLKETWRKDASIVDPQTHAKEREAIRILWASIAHRVAQDDPYSADSLKNGPMFARDSSLDLGTATTDYPEPTQAQVQDAFQLLQERRSDRPRWWMKPSRPVDWLLVLPAWVLDILRFPALLAVALAFLLRGSPTLLLSGIAMQTTSGERAGRWRCTLRAAVALSPILVYGALRLVESTYPTLLSWHPIIVFPVIAVASILIGIAYSIWRPQRGLAEILTGTHLVVRW